MNINRFFCWIGWHEWKYQYQVGPEPADRQCLRCGRFQYFDDFDDTYKDYTI